MQYLPIPQTFYVCGIFCPQSSRYRLFIMVKTAKGWNCPLIHSLKMGRFVHKYTKNPHILTGICYNVLIRTL